MTRPPTNKPPAVRKRKSKRQSRKTAVSPVRPKPVEKIIPVDVMNKLRDRVEALSEISSSTVKTLDQEFEIEARYGVTPRRLGNYLRKIASADREKANTTEPAAPKRGTSDAWSKKLGAHRKRQASVASILDATFGHLEDCKPELWDRRAYWMLVGLVYERIATNESEIPTDELVTLAKILAESRRIEVKIRETSGASTTREEDVATDGPIPERLADIVRQVYGTTISNKTDTSNSLDETSNGRAPSTNKPS